MDQKRYPLLQGIDFPVLKDSDITLSIGTNHADLFHHIDFCQRQNGEPTVV